jgi:hypothetical protein
VLLVVLMLLPTSALLLCWFAAGVYRDGEDELYYNMLLEEDPWNKLQVQAVLSGICLTASSVICWLCDKDPAGAAWMLAVQQLTTLAANRAHQSCILAGWSA